MYLTHITMDSFGSDCPANWQEISDYLNSQIDALEDIVDEDTGELTFEGRDAVDNIWKTYWDAFHSGALPEGAPRPIID